MTKTRLVVLGDSTTTGNVMTATSAWFSAGRQVAKTGDLASCRVCKGTFPILGTATGMLTLGQCNVQDQDRVLCGCDNHRVYAGSQFYQG